MEDTFAESSLFMSLSQIAAMILGFFTHLIITRTLGPELFGIFAVCMSTIAILTSVETGLSTALTKHLSEYQTKNDKSKSYSVFKTNFVLETLLTIFFILILLPIVYLTKIFGDYKYVFFFLLPILMLNTYQGFLGSSLIALKRMKLFSINRLMNSGVYFFLVIFLVHYLDYKLYGVLSAFFISSVFYGLILYSNVVSVTKHYFKKNKALFFKEALFYALPVTIAAFISSTIISGGPIIFKFLSDNLTQLGFFSVLLALGNRGRQLLLSIYKSAFPYVSSWYVSKQNEKIIKLIIYCIVGIATLMILLSILLSFIGESLIFLLYGKEYLPVSNYLVLTCIVYLVASFKDFVTMLLNSTGMPIKNLVGLLFAFLFFITSLFLISSRTAPTFAILFSIGFSYFVFSVGGLFILIREFQPSGFAKALTKLFTVRG